MFATFKTSSLSFSLYVLFTAPVSPPPCPGSSTISPLQPISCAAASGAKAIVARRPATRTAARIDAHHLKELISVIPRSLLKVGRGKEPPPRVNATAWSLHPGHRSTHPPDGPFFLLITISLGGIGDAGFCPDFKPPKRRDQKPRC